MHWKDILDCHYDQALLDGFPLFNGNSSNSNPFNAAPYMVPHEKFLFQAASWPGRSELLHELQACLAEAREAQLLIDGLLIGGSYIDFSNLHPKDIDCVWLYRTETGRGKDVELLKSLQSRFKSKNVDMRFVPTDADPLLFAKTLGFFVLLYAVGHLEEYGDIRAPLLVDCTGSNDGSC